MRHGLLSGLGVLFWNGSPPCRQRKRISDLRPPSPGYLELLKNLRSTGYRLYLYYLWTPSCELLLSRIRQRIATGGHAVPDQDVRRRYDRSLKNLKTYTAIMDKIRIFDNSGMKPVLVYEKNDEAIVYDTVRFAQMKLEIALWRHP